MTEQASTSASSSASFKAALVKFMLLLTLLAAVWLVFTQLIPRFWQHEESSSLLPPSPVALPDAQGEPLAALRARVEALEAKLKTFEDLIAAMPKPEEVILAAPPIPPAPLGSDEAAPGDRAAAQMEERFQAQEAAIGALHAQMKESQAAAAGRLAALVVFGQMKEEVGRGYPYRASLDRMTSLTKFFPGAREPLEALASDADAGAPTHAGLMQSFAQAVPRALAREAGSLEGRLRSLITIRKVGDQPGQTDEAVIARAEAKLAQGHITDCRKELSALAPGAASAFADWLKLAARHDASQAALAALEIALVKPEQE